MAEERVQKILANAGLGSRRFCEKYIEAGRVTVNGQVIKLGAKADPAKDQIKLDGKEINPLPDYVYIALYKPRGILSSTKTEHGRKSVLDIVPVPERVFPVGRLDIESEGLMLLTNDGELANLLTHPRYGHEKEYKILIARHPDEDQLAAWRRGVVLEDGYRSQPAFVQIDKLQGKGAWLKVVMKEGRKRQIRETAAQLGLPIVKLIRIRIGSLKLGGLRPGQFRPLTPAEVRQLQRPEIE
ncbi:MAG: rRNA pseudouridine synthase [Anaerolineales bacterium]|nr:rRNA pseudouridine synthase [Anaerolineales bacterium]